MLVPIPAYQSLDRILHTLLGDYTAQQKTAIIQANHLEWPYLVEGPESTQGWASGTATITWTGSTPTTMPSNTLINAPLATGIARQYATTQSVTFTAPGTQTVPIVATVAGEFGNAPPDSLQEIPAYPTATVTNTEPIIGGFLLRVLKPGDLLWIPDTYTLLTPVPRTDQAAYNEAIGETDIWTSPTGGMQWATDDLLLQQGSLTILQDMGHRLVTPRGSLPWDPAIGSLLHTALGSSSAGIVHRLTALSLSAILQDPRIQHAQVTLQPLPEDVTWYALQVLTNIFPQPYTLPLKGSA